MISALSGNLSGDFRYLSPVCGAPCDVTKGTLRRRDGVEKVTQNKSLLNLENKNRRIFFFSTFPLQKDRTDVERVVFSSFIGLLGLRSFRDLLSASRGAREGLVVVGNTSRIPEATRWEFINGWMGGQGSL